MRNALIVLVVLVVAFGAGFIFAGLRGGLPDNTPEGACAADLEVATLCVPTGEQRAVSLFEPVAGVDGDVTELAQVLDDPLAGALSATCNSMPDIFTVCITSENGITVITPIVMPDDGRVRFEGPGLDDLPSVRLAEPVGLRRSTGVFNVLVLDSDDTELGTVGVGFYP